MTRQPSFVVVVAALSLACAGAVAQTAPAKPLEIIAPPAAKSEPNPIVVEDSKTRRERRAYCEGQADKLYASQKKQFMKECMASKG
jgi:hypothetical protein